MVSSAREYWGPMPCGVVIGRSLIPDVTSVTHGARLGWLDDVDVDVHVLRDELVEDEIGLADVLLDVGGDRLDQFGVADRHFGRPSVLVHVDVVAARGAAEAIKQSHSKLLSNQ